jgi:hypothetical protein
MRRTQPGRINLAFLTQLTEAKNRATLAQRASLPQCKTDDEDEDAAGREHVERR